MAGENRSQKNWLKNIDETRNYFLQEIEQNELMCGKYKKVFTTLNYIEHFLILAFTITRCISIFASASFDWYSCRNYEFCKRITNLYKKLQELKL